MHTVIENNPIHTASITVYHSNGERVCDASLIEVRHHPDNEFNITGWKVATPDGATTIFAASQYYIQT